jgi:ceramide glucosyltransferase
MIALVALAVWSAIVAVVSAWALCAPWALPLVRRALAALRPAPLRLAPINGSGERPVRVLLLRPCAGRDASLEDNLRSLGPFEGLEVRCVFAVGSEGDPANDAITEAIASLRSRGVACERIVTGAVGPNHKADQLARAQARCDFAADVVMVADSDVDLAGVDLGAMAGPLARGEHACVWVAVSERGEDTLGDRASGAVLSGGLHAFSLLSRLDPHGMVGKLFALRADALSSVGGFASLVRYLGEDMELSRRLRAQGLSVRALALRARSSARGRSLTAVRDRYARWLLVVRTQRPGLLASYPLLFFAAPVQSLCAIALAWVSPWALAVLALVVGARVMVAVAARRASGLTLSLRAVLVDLARHPVPYGEPLPYPPPDVG